MIIYTILCMLVLVISVHLANSDYVWLEREYINGDGMCRYLTRWHLLRGRKWSVYLHHFVGDDWSLDCHDHPKAFISIGIWGSYCEETLVESADGLWRTEYRDFHAPWIRRFPALHTHRLMLYPLGRGVKKRPCWTIAIVGESQRDWGWWVEKAIWPKFSDLLGPVRPASSGKYFAWVRWDRYVANRNVAHARKSCG